MLSIYVLELENGKFYVGKTTNPEYRLESHFQNNGSEWTKLHKPVRVLEIIKNCDDYDEDKYTRIYMDKYGIDNVRGGSFVTVQLSSATIDHLRQMSNRTNDKCFRCGIKGHFVKNCRESLLSCRSCKADFISLLEFENHYDSCVKSKEGIREKKDKPCNCFASTFSPHRASKCIFAEDKVEEITRKTKTIKIKEPAKLNACFRCGRNSHFAQDCFASTHIYGKKL